MWQEDYGPKSKMRRLEDEKKIMVRCSAFHLHLDHPYWRVFGVGGKGLPTSNPDWVWQNPLPQGDDILKITFLSTTEGWAVGMSQGVFHTIDGGKTWEVNRFGPPLGFYDVFFVDNQHGWVVGQDSYWWNYNEGSIIWN
jgi:photosystem II stability/assembly factor-like uncharacterized protein